MSNQDPDVLFWALQRAINNRTPDTEANGIRASVREYLGIPNIRMSDRVLLATIRRRLQARPMDIPPDRVEPNSPEVQARPRPDVNEDAFEKYKDLFEL